MLHYFRINDPYRFIGLLIILVILYLPFFIDPPQITFPELKSTIVGQKIGDGFSLYSQIIDFTEPLTGWFYAFCDFVFGSSVIAKRILGFIFLFVITATLGIIFIDKKAFPESTFIPPLIFGVIGVFSFDSVSLTGELPALFFLLLGLNSLFREIESREQYNEMVLKTGVFIGISSLFNFSYVVYTIGTLFILMLFTRTSGRKILLMLSGFFLPHLLLIGIYEINGSVEALWRFFYAPNLGFDKVAYSSTSNIMLLIAIPLGFFLAAMVVLNRESRFTKYQSQLLQAMFFWTVFSILQVYYSQDFRPQSFLTVMVGFSFFISHFFSIIIRKRFAELTFWLFMAGIASVSYLCRYSVINKGVYDRLIAHTTPGIVGKKVLMLDDNLVMYYGNRMATPFLNWKLSEAIFTAPEYYDNVITVYNGFKGDMPEIIIDPKDLMRPFLEKIPELRKRYKRTSDGYLLVSSPT